VYQLILPSLLEVLARSQSTQADFPSPEVEWTTKTENDRGNADTNNNLRAERQWRLAIAATEHLLLQSLHMGNGSPTKGLVLAGPVPVFSHPALMTSLQTMTFTAKPLNGLALMPFQLPPAIETATEAAPCESVLPLLLGDPVADEQFCLVLTAKFSLVLVLGEDNSGKAFSFSFEPEVVEQAWRALRSRVVLSNPDCVTGLDALVEKYSPIAPDYRTVMQFSQLLLKQLPNEEEDKGNGREKVATCPVSPASSVADSHSSPLPDVELLQAFAHEVRTPLTTIRTLTRLLLKRRDLSDDVIKRLQIIDHECTEQIDRMELLFRAAELEISNSVKNSCAHLTPMSLDQVLQQSIPRWQQAASRRSLTLEVVVPQHIPNVVSNPAMLDRVLTGLMENFTRSLPAGSHIQVDVIPAGDQLKLQLLPQPQSNEDGKATQSSCNPPTGKSIGQLLMFQPETGTISLNLAATKHLFQAIGGKLIVRQRPQQGEVLTIFLPLKN
jgi:hypothetical protein